MKQAARTSGCRAASISVGRGICATNSERRRPADAEGTAAVWPRTQRPAPFNVFYRHRKIDTKSPIYPLTIYSYQVHMFLFCSNAG